MPEVFIGSMLMVFPPPLESSREVTDPAKESREVCTKNVEAARLPFRQCGRNSNKSTGHEGASPRFVRGGRSKVSSDVPEVVLKDIAPDSVHAIHILAGFGAIELDGVRLPYDLELSVGICSINVAPPLWVIKNRRQNDTTGSVELGGVCIGSVKVKSETKWHVVVIPPHMPAVVELKSVTQVVPRRFARMASIRVHPGPVIPS